MEVTSAPSVKKKSRNITAERCRHESRFTPEQNKAINQVIEKTVTQLTPMLATYHRQHLPGMQAECTKDYSEELGKIIAANLLIRTQQYAIQEARHERNHH